jgi:hypothetical protein
VDYRVNGPPPKVGLPLHVSLDLTTDGEDTRLWLRHEIQFVQQQRIPLVPPPPPVSLCVLARHPALRHVGDVVKLPGPAEVPQMQKCRMLVSIPPGRKLRNPSSSFALASFAERPSRAGSMQRKT